MPPEPEPNTAADNRIDASIRHHTHRTLNEIADQIAVMAATVTALDTATVEATADHDTSDLVVRVAAARSALSQITATALNIEMALGRLEGLAQAVDILEAERPQ